MPKYIFAYHGGTAPESPEEQQQVMAAWMSWIGSHGDSFVDPGAPVGDSRTVTAGGVEDHGGPSPLSGYGFVTADTIEAAIEIAKGCPILEDGGTVEVASVHEM
ncbi:MAG: hypothetical protein QNJ44_10230 [Rhodobacter sp.]|nr:hypothetical protein [Rhodobacter sp.]